MTDVNDSSKNAIPRSFTSNNLEVTFDDRNDRVKFLAKDLNILKDIPTICNDGVSCPSYMNDWYHAQGAQNGRNAGLSFTNGMGSASLHFGDADDTIDQPYNQNLSENQWTQSAYLNKKVFGAILKNKNIALGSCSVIPDKCFTEENLNGVDNAGAIVSWETIDEKDRDFMSDNAIEPSLEYMSWGVWAFAASDFEKRVSGINESYESAAVHMGTWYAGDLLDVNDWPVDRTATLAGMAMFDIFARIEESGQTNSYHWTEGADARGILNFSTDGTYGISISVDNLGTENCPSTYCASTFDSNMSKGPMGTITWSTQGGHVRGNPNFVQPTQIITRNVGGKILYEYKSMAGSLYGTSSHVEAGAQLAFTRGNDDEMIMLRGTAVLSE